MRKIERDMIAAIRAGKNRSLGNTRVIVYYGDEARWQVLLHGNCIATQADGEPFRFTLAGWPTPTTRSRITALLQTFIHANARVYQEDGRQKFHSPTGEGIGWSRRTITPTEWVQA